MKAKAEEKKKSQRPIPSPNYFPLQRLRPESEAMILDQQASLMKLERKK